jgi:hypothetical protein
MEEKALLGAFLIYPFEVGEACNIFTLERGNFDDPVRGAFFNLLFNFWHNDNLWSNPVDLIKKLGWATIAFDRTFIADLAAHSTNVVGANVMAHCISERT